MPETGDIGFVENGNVHQDRAPMSIVLETENLTSCWFFEIDDKLNVKIGHLNVESLKAGVLKIIKHSEGWVSTCVFANLITNDPSRSEKLTASLADAQNERIWKEKALAKLKVCTGL